MDTIDSQKYSSAPSISIIGAGVVGVATGRGFAEHGARVTFLDISATRVAELANEGLDARLAEDHRSSEFDFHLISVSTPTVRGRVDLGPVRSAAKFVGRSLREQDSWTCVVVRSTVPPGTTDDVVRPIIEEESGKVAGRDFGLSMNPEFLRAATAYEDFVAPRVIVFGGTGENSESSMRRLYEPWKDVELVAMSNREAEATKYTANLFNAAKISFFNELHDAFKGLGIDSTLPFETAAKGAEGLWNPVYGIRGGEAFSGVCLPKDTAAFIGFGRDLGIDLRILEAVVETNVRLGGDRLIDEAL